MFRLFHKIRAVQLAEPCQPDDDSGHEPGVAHDFDGGLILVFVGLPQAGLAEPDGFGGRLHPLVELQGLLIRLHILFGSGHFGFVRRARCRIGVGDLRLRVPCARRRLAETVGCGRIQASLSGNGQRRPPAVGSCTVKEDQFSVVYLAVHAAFGGKALQEGEIAFFPLILSGESVFRAVVHEFQPIAPGHVSGQLAERE